MKMVVHRVLAALILATACFRPCLRASGQTSAQPRLETHFRAGQRALQEGNLDLAVQEFSAVLRLNPGLSQARINLGLAYHLRGEYALAAKELERGLRENPGVAGAEIVLGIDEMKLGDAARAVAPLERAASLEPSNPEPPRHLVPAYLALGKYFEAQRAARAAFQNSHQSAGGWFQLGMAYLQMAKQLSARLARGDQSAAWTGRLAGDLLAARGLWSDAARQYRLALARASPEAGSDTAQHNALLARGRPEEAAAEYQRELALELARLEVSPTSVPACKTGHYEACAKLLESRRTRSASDNLMLGKALFELRRDEQAGDALAAARPHSNPEAAYWLVHTYLRLADDCFSALSAAFPNSPEAHELQAENYRVRGADSEAIKEYELAAAMEPNNASLDEALGELYLNQHNVPQAEHELQKALALDHTRARTLYLLGRVALGEHEPEKAIGLLERALRYEPGLLVARASLGMAYLRAGNPALAAQQLEKSAALDIYGDLHYMLHQAYKQLGKSALAREALARSQALRRKTQTQDEARIHAAEEEP